MPSRKIVFAVRGSSSISHVLPDQTTMSRSALCGLVPERDWARIWEHTTDEERLIGICEECWHRAKRQSVGQRPSP